MKTKTIALIVAAVILLAIGYVLSTGAQEVGWDTDEEVQRLQQKQQNEIEQGGADDVEATEMPTPLRPSAGEKKLEKWEGVPTGYIKREYMIHQDNLAGKWQDANIFPASNSEPKWLPITIDQYNDALKSGTVDGKLKGTVYGPFYENMMRICKAAPEAKAAHVRTPEDSPEWRMDQSMQRPYTLYRELSFECLAELKKE